MMRWALVIEYDGSAYHGWQRQPQSHVLGVQSCVESAISAVADHEVSTVCAGRTDTGVHALGQVVHFDTAAQRSPRSWRLGISTHLPSTVSVVWAGAVDDSFSARFSAVERRYRYVILNRSSRSAVHHNRVWCVPQRLDIARMRAAGTRLPGEHDFSAFRAADCQAHSASRYLSELEIDGFGDYIVIRVAANAFLKNMVRIIVGVLVSIGNGDRNPGWIDELLGHGDRTRSGLTAPAAGLYLAGVRYPREYGIPIVRPGPGPIP